MRYNPLILCRPLVTLIVLISLTASRPATAQAPYTVTDLGTLGGAISYAQHLNEAGIVVGEASNSANSYDAAYYQSGAWTGLGLSSGSSTSAIACGINNANPVQIVGTQYLGPLNPPTRAFLYQNGVVTWLPTFGDDANAYKINDAGQIVGSAVISISNGKQTHACLWYHGVINDLGTLPGGSASAALNINAYGYAVGYSNTSGGSDHAVYWDSTGIHDFGVLPGGSNSYCYGVVPGGSVLFPVGGSETKDSNGNIVEHACIFPGIDLGTLGGATSSAYAINDYYQIVGSSELADSTFSAFLYSYFGTVMYDLNTMIPSGSGWTLTMARAANDHGQITGYGEINGNVHAFLLTPTYHIASLTVKPTTVVGSLTATGTVTLDSPALFDLVVYLGGGANAIPESCIIPAEETSQSFLIDTTAVTSTKTVTISADLYGTGKSATLTIRPIGVKALSLNPSTIKGGNIVTGKVAPADPDSITVSLSSSNPAIANPAVSSLTVPRGSSNDTFTITTNPVTSTTVVTITASANGITKKTKLTVTP